MSNWLRGVFLPDNRVIQKVQPRLNQLPLPVLREYQETTSTDSIRLQEIRRSVGFEPPPQDEKEDDGEDNNEDVEAKDQNGKGRSNQVR
jgi:hypothetical protein